MRDIGSEKIVKHHSQTNKFLQYLHQKQKEGGIINKQNNQYKAKCSCKLDKKLKIKKQSYISVCLLSFQFIFSVHRMDDKILSFFPFSVCNID